MVAVPVALMALMDQTHRLGVTQLLEAVEAAAVALEAEALAALAVVVE